MKITRLLLLMLIALPMPGQAELYRWVDDQGQTHFSDQPQDDRAERFEVQVQTIEFVTTGEIDFADIPSRSRGGGLVMYSTQRCGYCKRARDYFQRENIAYTEKDIDMSQVARKEFEQLGGTGVPLFINGKQKMSGFSESRFSQWYSRIR